MGVAVRVDRERDFSHRCFRDESLLLMKAALGAYQSCFFFFLPVSSVSVLERFCWHCTLMSYRMIICSCAERGPSTSIWGEKVSL